MAKKNIYIVIDYFLRVPEFEKSYSVLKNRIISAEGGDHSFWENLHKTDPKAFEFYKTTESPTSDIEDIDITYRKYFYNDNHRYKFLEEYSFNLFGAGQITDKNIVQILNITQSKLANVYLIDRITTGRKIGNTFSFLGRSGLFIKGIEFVNTDKEIEKLGKNKKTALVINPFINPEHKLLSFEKLKDILISLEKTL